MRQFGSGCFRKLRRRQPVFGSYKIDGKEYQTLLADGVNDGWKTSPFHDNTTITSLTFADGVKINNCSNYFTFCTSLETIDFSGLDTSECSDFSAMFSECNSLQTVDLSPLNFDSLTKLYDMFNGCNSLTAVYVNQNFYDYVYYSDKMKNNENMFEDSSITDFTVK